jgi:HEAT repeat protein
MERRIRLLACFLLIGGQVWCHSQDSTDVESPRHKAWNMLQRAATAKHTAERTDGVRALGLLRGDVRARKLAEEALKDRRPEVRTAAATALGQMQATESIPLLEHALMDLKIPVVMAAAHSLFELKDEAAAYGLYYDLLSGSRRTGDGLIAQQIETLKNPRELAKIGFSEGIGYVPFAGIGWDAWRTMHKKNPNPVKAVAATYLAHDPDPATGLALVKATRDKDWIVRAAAVEAIAQRGDASLLHSVESRFADKSAKVRYTAAAAVIRLTPMETRRTARNSNEELKPSGAQ